MKQFYTLLLIMYAGLFSNITAQNISFYADNTNGCAPLIVNFTNTSSVDTSGVTFFWSFGDGSNTVTGFNATHTFMNAGNYYVTLNAYNGPNYLGSSNYYIYVNGASSSFYMNTGTQACPGQNVQFGTNDFTNWTKWYTSDGDSSQGNWFSHTFVNSGIYYITLIENTFCGTDTIIQTLTVSNSAVNDVQIGFNGGNSFCPGESITFIDMNPASSFIWDFGDGSFSVASEPQHQFSPAGDYQVVLHATNMCGNTSIDSAWVYIQDSMPVYAYINSWPNDVCPGENVNFSSGNAGQYLWNFGDGTTSTASNISHAYADTGNYNVSLIITNACGNSDTAYSSVLVNYHPSNPPYAQIEFDNFENWNNGFSIDTLMLCPNTLVMFRNNSWSNGSTLNYFWDFGDGSNSTQMNVSHTYVLSGMHPVKMIASNNCGASDTAYKWIYIDPAILPNADLHAIPTAICPGETVYFFDDNSKDNENGNSYSIWFGDGTSQLNITQNTDTVLQTLSSHLYANAGNYNYIFTVTNSCGNTDTLSGTITVGPTTTPFYYIHNSTSNYYGPDWSMPQSPTDHQFFIPVHFPQWVPGMNNKFFIAFWYGNVDFSGDPGEPAGLMSMTGLGTAHAYVPVESDSVTIAGAWSCNGQLGGGNNNGPDAFGVLGVFPLVQNGVTNIPEPGIQITGWDGTCDTAQVQNPYAACPGDNVDFMVVGGLTYEWHFGDGSTSTLQNTSHVYTLAGTYDATCIITTGCNQKDTIHTEVVIANDNIPSSFFYTGNYNGCSGSPIQFYYQQNYGNSDSYSFLWNFGDGTTSIERDPVHTFLNGGQFNISLTVSNGCGSSTSYNTYYIGPEVHSIVSDGCAGANDGFIDLTVNSNQNNTNFQWSNGSNDEDIFNLAPGTYTVTITSGNNCQFISSYTIDQVATLTASAVVTSISCTGSDDGEISISVSGGVSPFAYLWSTGDDTQVVVNLTIGTYSITVIDAGGCSDIISESISEPSLLIASNTGTDVACNGANTGQAVETALGGTQPYFYLWSDLQITATAINLAAGTYYVTITDAHNCEVIDSVIISEPPAYNFNFNVTQSTCGTNNGSITLNVSGGTPSYTYLWSDAGANTTPTVTALSSGIYYVTVSDNHSCDTVLAIALNDNNAPSISSAITNVLCFGQSNGSIAITTTGGTFPYTYNWSNLSNASSISNLSAGPYYLTVTDNAACNVFGVYTIEQPELLTLETSQVNTLCYQSCNGTATVVPQGGTSPYTYSWGSGGTNSSVTNLCAGLQNITVTDYNGCAENTSVTITEPSQIAINLTGYDVQCFGDATGYITTSVTGGTGTYDYAWSNGDLVQNISGLVYGSYTLTVTDDNLCTNLETVNISQPVVIADSFISTDATSSTALDGAINLTVTGGVQPYSYVWSNGASTEDISGLLTGNYVISVTDANNCNLSDTIFVNFSNAVNDLSLASATKIYPNPATGILYIENAENTSIEIMNILGNVILTIKKASYLNNIDMNIFPAGNYFVKISKGDKSVVKKFILK